jgi:hypothetical protein
MTERIITAFDLPDYLKTMIFHDGLVTEAGYITQSGIMQLALHFVSANFDRHQNHLVIEPLALPSGVDQSNSLDRIIEEQFQAVGLEKYLRTVRKKERLLPMHAAKKK